MHVIVFLPFTRNKLLRWQVQVVVVGWTTLLPYGVSIGTWEMVAGFQFTELHLQLG